ncbi:MAG TPA: cupredoxin domain-containing protein [Vitreimonas sp.]|nr:cupredoxin domain-containing protein [Vitreimonas sp.]
MSRVVLPIVTLLVLLVAAACGGATGSPAAGTDQPAEPGSPAAPSPADTGSAACESSTDTATVEVTISGNAFSPDPVQATVGDVISWTNVDPVPHSAVVSAGCSTPTLRDGDVGSLVFTAAGSYPYVCGIHSNMRGTIEVGD